MSNGFGRVPVSPEMNALEREVSCDEQFLARRDVEYRAVIPYTGNKLSE